MEAAPGHAETKQMIRHMSGQLDEAMSALVEGREKEELSQRQVRDRLHSLHLAVEDAMSTAAPRDADALRENLGAVQRETDKLLEGKAAAERRAAELERELAEVSAERDAYRQQAEAQGGLLQGLAPGSTELLPQANGGGVAAASSLSDDPAELRGEITRLRAQVAEQAERLVKAVSVESALLKLAEAEAACAAASSAAEASMAAAATLTGRSPQPAARGDDDRGRRRGGTRGDASSRAARHGGLARHAR